MNINSHKDKGVERIRAKDLGRFGEERAAVFLKRCGYKIVATNFRTPIGRNRKGVSMSGEIDIIALDGSVLCFIEVKTRGTSHYSPEISVTPRKKRQIARTARSYMNEFEIKDIVTRFDVISVVDIGTGAPGIKHIKKYWSPGIIGTE